MPAHVADGAGAGAGAGAVPLSVALGGLEPYKAYAYRPMAQNDSVGASTGPLCTAPIPPFYTEIPLLTPPYTPLGPLGTAPTHPLTPPNTSILPRRSDDYRPDIPLHPLTAP